MCLCAHLLRTNNKNENGSADTKQISTLVMVVVLVDLGRFQRYVQQTGKQNESV